MTEEEVKKLIKENIKEFMADYYRETHPGYEIASGSKTLGHGESEYCMSTDSLQGIHFYKNGVCKMVSNKSMELRTGESSKKTECSFVIASDQGKIKITAENGDLILEGRNVLIESTGADGAVSINSKKNVYVRCPEYTVDSTMFTASATLDMLLSGGNLSLYSEAAPIQLGAGVDAVIGPTVFDTAFNLIEKARAFFKR